MAWFCTSTPVILMDFSDKQWEGKTLKIFFCFVFSFDNITTTQSIIGIAGGIHVALFQTSAARNQGYVKNYRNGTDHCLCPCVLLTELRSWKDRAGCWKTESRWRLLLTSGGAKRRVFSKQYVHGNVMCESFRAVLCVWNVWYWYPEWRVSKTQNNSGSSVVNLQDLLGTARG